MPKTLCSGLAVLALLGLLAGGCSTTHPGDGAMLSTNAAAAGLKVYFGNLHSHTSYSDGSGTPEDAYRHARHTAHLDFLAITEHNHSDADGSGDRKDGILVAKNKSLYTGPQASGLVPTAGRWTENGKFVALYGQEFSAISKGNHVNVFDVTEVIDDQVVPSGEFKKLVEWLATRPDSTGKAVIVQFNHPALHNNNANEYGADDFGGHDAWFSAMSKHVSLIEMLNGPAMEKVGGKRAAEVL